MKSARKPDVKRIVVWLSLFLLLVLIIFAIRLVLEYRSSLWAKEQDRIGILFYTSPVILISFSRSEEAHSIMTLPEAALTRVPFGYGEYRLGATWKLGQLEKKRELFAETVADLTGVRINGWFGLDEPISLSAATDAELLNSLKEHFSLSSLFRKGFATNLGKLDTVMMGLLFNALKPGNTLIYLADRNEYLFQADELPNQVPVKKVNQVAFAEYLEQKFENPLARSDGLTMQIVNTTDVTGVGSNFAKYLNHYGGKVIAVVNDIPTIPNCEVKVNAAHENAQIVKYLVNEFMCTKLLTTDTLEADIEVLVGQVFADRWK
ncbi:TPA: hypothetical protein DIV55_07130 [Patescibacteria group bacterium]|uniref:LytR/CpsA/Psr regulator C-terminal domain-containing protein n=1 Tax=Candidatus Gottesmanbacteria bacterium GW2011_GWA1_43_11 TaxID=1618436 RepID=A0A0G1EQL3_9BACT|nr:MAG: hypothetical protein UV59_C0008G0019 [Candidatus Gottesmanbacteria bacterium GW2011_GWA1_43_11]HCS79475.1 hypothetical protein [Patescibacteria group bacterium]